MLFLLLAFLLQISYWIDAKHASCLGPPYLYLTTHDEIQNVAKYSRDGCLLSSSVISPSPSPSSLKLPKFVELRSMAFASHWDGQRLHSNALFISDAVSEHSAIHAFSDCSKDGSGHRTLLDTVLTTSDNRGADHTYGLVFDAQQRMFASFQHTDVVLSLALLNTSTVPGKPWRYRFGDFPPAIQRPERSQARDNESLAMTNKRYNQPDHWYDYFPGTFYQFGKPQLQKQNDQGIRSIIILHYCSDGTVVSNNDFQLGNITSYHYNNASALQHKTIVKSLMWIADEDINGMLVVDLSTGLAENVVTVHNPIHSYFHGITQKVYVSSKRKHWRGAVFAIDPHTLKITAVYETFNMNHPTGITIYENILYVGMQERAEVLKFNVKTRKYLGVAVKHIRGEIEHILLSPC